jgi:serine/threonine protein kinase
MSMSDLPKPAQPPPGTPAAPGAETGSPRDVNTGGAATSEQPTLDPAALPSAGPCSLVGRVFGDFELLAEIGRGGMGIVYKARQKSLERTVALKMLLTQQFTSPAVVPRFLAEARAAASLSHPNIVNVYQVGECPVGHYFVMELIEGQSLESLLQERTIPVSWAASFMIVVTEAVHYAHTRGIVHRDLKPANIMIDRHRRPIVMDFGLAKFLGKPSGLTQEGAIMGTPAYMSPEQADGDPSLVGPASDVYSLGAILYTLLTGRPTYDEGTPLKTILKVIAPDPPASIRSLRPDVPPAMERICLKCLGKRPADRYSSAQALADDLRRFRAASAQPQTATSVRTMLPSVVLVSEETGKRVRLFNATTVLGRSQECDLVVRAAEVSKRHCRIVLTADEVVVEDLGSANGTCVNGRPVERAVLADGDRLDLGGHIFQVRLAKRKG